MPWHCPGCGVIIEHTGDTPKSGVQYRCHRCRIILRFNRLLKRMIAVRIDDADRPRKKKKRR
jgi:hypothetical protein